MVADSNAWIDRFWPYTFLLWISIGGLIFYRETPLVAHFCKIIFVAKFRTCEKSRHWKKNSLLYNK